MQAALALADNLDAQAILDMHEVLLGASHPEWVGHWRDEQVWIGGSDYGPHGAIFVPPHHERVPASMSDLVAFMRRDLLLRQPVVDSPLVQRELGVAATNANAAIEHLAEKEILRKVSGKYRNRKWSAPDVLEALDDFAARSGRRPHRRRGLPAP